MSNHVYEVGVVACWRYPDASSSAAVYARLKEAATCEAEATVYRFRMPARDGWYVAFVALDPLIFADVDYGAGDPVRLSDSDAAHLIGRWAEVRNADADRHPIGTPVRREAHYENGRSLDSLGGTLPPDAA